MKKYILVLHILLVVCVEVVAQQPRFIFSDKADTTHVHPVINEIDTANLKKDSVSIYAWRIDPRFGQRTMVDRDTLHIDFHTKSLIDNRDVSVGYLGNIGTPAQSRIYFNRPEKSQFYFLEAFDYYRKNPENNDFINTKEPYSNIYYQSAGGGQTKEEHLKFELTMNFGKKINLGMHLDYLYARGFYLNLSNKQFNYDVYGSYIDKKFEIHGFVANNYFNNSENGGILGDSILAETPSRPSKDIPEAVSGVWNKLRGRHIFLTGKYNLGVQDDTDVPIASAIYTTHYNDQKRELLAKNPIIDGSIYPVGLILPDTINDYFAYWSFKNTFAVALNEGFREWVKFGLKAFIEQDIRKYSQPVQNFPIFNEQDSQSETRIGGVLSKRQGTLLKYDLSADFAVTGYNIGEFNLVGDISTSIPIKGKFATLKAKGYIKNLKPTFFENNYISSADLFNRIDKGFSNTRKVYIGGELNIPHTGTILTGGVENIENMIYGAADKSLKQNSGNVQVVSFGAEQKLKAGILHWDNQVVFQTSSDEDILPLPKVSVYSNLYIETVLAKVLKMQLGFDARYFTEYYAPSYNPFTIEFYNQQETKIGNFPITTVYANLHLQKTRFFLMMYNVTGRMGNAQYFAAPHYPVIPMTLKFGLSWDFNN